MSIESNVLSINHWCYRCQKGYTKMEMSGNSSYCKKCRSVVNAEAYAKTKHALLPRLNEQRKQQRKAQSKIRAQNKIIEILQRFPDLTEWIIRRSEGA